MPKLGVVPMSLKSVQMRHRIHLDANSSFNMLALCSRRLTIAHYRYALNMKAKRLFSESAVEETEQAEDKDRLSKNAFVMDPIGPHQATLIWLHGLGDMKTNFKQIYDLFKFQGMRLVVPEAPKLPVSAFEDKIMPTWFDMPKQIDRDEDPRDFEDDRIGILLAAHSVFELLQDEQKLIGLDKIILGGASVGGALAIHTGLRHKQKLAGIVSVSGYVPLLNEYPKFLRPANRKTPILAIHGYEDPFIPVEFARTSYQHLKEHGALVNYNEDRTMDNRLRDQGMFLMKSWLQDRGDLPGKKPL